MKVRELVHTLQQLPDQEATVVISHGADQDVFLVVAGVVGRGIRRLDGNFNFAGPGTEPLQAHTCRNREVPFGIEITFLNGCDICSLHLGRHGVLAVKSWCGTHRRHL